MPTERHIDSKANRDNAWLYPTHAKPKALWLTNGVAIPVELRAARAVEWGRADFLAAPIGPDALGEVWVNADSIRIRETLSTQPPTAKETIPNF